MKKTLCSALTTALIVGAASTTFAAANPFSDVPADHWAYDAVSELAADGIIEGYGDGTYRGQRQITRYEMAQMVAKAMAKSEQADAQNRALIDRLAAEFSDELNNLGVRVSALEEKVDNVKWNGKIEYTYTKTNFEGADRDRTENGFVFRLEPKAKVNDHWNVHARLDANVDTKKDTSTSVKLKRAWAQGNYDNFTVKLGKMELLTPEAYVSPGAIIFDTTFSGAEVSFGKNLKTVLQAGRASVDEKYFDAADYQSISLQYADEKIRGGIGYYRVSSEDLRTYIQNKGDDANIWAANLGYNFDRNSLLSGAYAHNKDAADYKKSYQITYQYKGAKAEDAGSWGAYAAYRYLGNASIAPTTDGAQFGTKGWEVGTFYTPATNIILSARYFKGKEIEDTDNDVSKIFGRVEFIF